MGDFVKVAVLADLPPGGYLVVEYDEEEVILFHVDGEIYAVGNICTHDGNPLHEGEVEAYTITCPRHGARFDIRTGAVRSLPAYAPLPVYEVRVEGDDILIASQD